MPSSKRLVSSTLLFGLHLFNLANGCAFEHAVINTRSAEQLRDDAVKTTNFNLQARQNNNARRETPVKTVISNVDVFDGREILRQQTVIIENGRIVTDSAGTTESIDGTGQTLMPGLIDSHTHPQNFTHLQELTQYGVTTGFIMACPYPEICASLRNATGLTDVIPGSLPVVGNNSMHASMLRLNQSQILSNPAQLPGWVDQQISNGASFIKLVAEILQNGTSQEMLNAATITAHQKEKKVICHAADYPSQQQALTAKVDQVHHLPMERPTDHNTTARFLELGAISVPTLIMMNLTSRLQPGRLSFNVSMLSAKNIHAAGIPILVGTDSNGVELSPARPDFGLSMHQEMEYLVQAGMSPIEVLQAATSRPAQIWGLGDRGLIKPGMRADLLLVSGDPTKNISATRNIRRVWVAGHAYDRSTNSSTVPSNGTGSGNAGQSSSGVTSGASRNAGAISSLLLIFVLSLAI